MKVEFTVCDIDELSLGFHFEKGQDEDGQFHGLFIGFLVFELSILRYIK